MKLVKSDKKNNFRLSIFCLAFLFFMIYVSAWAQNVPSGQEPGAQAERYNMEAYKEKKRLEQKKSKTPEIKVEKEKTEPPKGGAAFVLREIKINGSTIFKPQDFRSLYAASLNQKVTFYDMDVITKKIESKYKEKGYFTTSVYIPQQDIKDGVIEINIAEGKMGKLNIEGNKWFSAEFIQKYFHEKENEVLNIKSMSRDILRINKNPDLEVKAVISQGKDPQSSDISLKVEGKMPWRAGLLEDNRGSRLTGKYRSMFFVRSSNVSGLGDTVFANFLYTGKSSAQFISYEIPIGTYGTKFGLDVTNFQMQLGKEFKSFDISGQTQIYSPHFSWELALTENYEAYADLGIDIKSVKKYEAGNMQNDDQLRTPYFGFDISKTDASGQTTFNPKFNFGTAGFLGSSHRNHPSASRAGTGGSFFKYEQGLNRVQRMFLESYISARTLLQVASHSLASSEQFQIGGMDSVRGYPEGDYSADTGGSLSLDWVFPMYLIPKAWKISGQDTALRYQIQPVVFADVGGGQLKSVLPGENRDKFLAGVGGGIRMQFKLFSLRLDWAKAIGDQPTSGSGPSTFYFTFQSEI